MKYWISKIGLTIIFLLTGIFVCSCDQELEILAPSIETPSIFCLVNPLDTSTEVRIERIYQGSQSAFQTGKIYDSLYYSDNLNVELELVNYLGESVDFLKLNPQIGPKDDGVFNSDSLYIFVLNDTLPFITRNPNNLYWNPLEIEYIKLNVSIPGEEVRVEGIIQPLSNPFFKYPDNYLKKIDVYKADDLSIVWGYDYKVKYTQIGMRFIYDELKNGILYNRTAIWVTDKGIFRGENGAYIQLYPEKFYRKICTVIKEDSKVTARYLREIQIEVFTADKYYELYKRKQLFAWNERLGEEINLKNAVGLYACIGRARKKGLNLNYKSMDSLARGQYTKHLKFRQW